MLCLIFRYDRHKMRRAESRLPRPQKMDLENQKLDYVEHVLCSFWEIKNFARSQIPSGRDELVLYFSISFQNFGIVFLGFSFCRLGVFLGNF